jgi:membrane protein DedA with SNARE-associated domain
MSLRRFLIYSTIGSGTWTAALAVLGYALGERSERVTHWIGPVSTTVLAGIVAYYLYRVATFKQGSAARSGASPSSERRERVL